MDDRGALAEIQVARLQFSTEVAVDGSVELGVVNVISNLVFSFELNLENIYKDDL